MRASTRFIGTIGVIVASATVTHGAELLDSRSILAGLEEAETVAPQGSSGAQLLKDIVRFRTDSASLPSAQAASRWFELLARASLPMSRGQVGNFSEYDAVTRQPVGVASVLAALPPPSAWQTLRSEATRRATANADSKRLSTRLLFEILNKDVGAAKTTLMQIELDTRSLDPSERQRVRALVTQVRRILTEMYGTPDEVIASLSEELDASTDAMFTPSISIPDLVGMVGVDRAQPILRKAVRSRSRISVNSGDATRKLARAIALEEIENMQVPQWELIDSTDGADLYRSIRDKFAGTERKEDLADGESLGSDYYKREAAIYYLLNAIVNRDQATAEATLLDIGRSSRLALPKKAVETLQRDGQAKALVEFLHAMLKAHPEVEAWDLYFEQSAYVGRSADALALVRSQLQRADVSERVQMELRNHAISALLASNRTSEAIAELRRLIKTSPHAEEKALLSRVKAAVRLATLGRLSNQPRLTSDALSFAWAALQLPHPGLEYERRELLKSVIGEYRKSNHARAAQDIAIADLKSESTSAGDRYQESFGIANPNSESVNALAELVGIFTAAGRHEDAIALLDGASRWSARDLREIITTKDSMGVPLGFSAAQSLHAIGKTEVAAAILWQLVDVLPGYDQAFELLATIGGDGLISKLDALSARDRFEERPLIWKAHWLLANNKFDEAEEAIRRAIAVDPSDGEQGSGDRLRAYTVLANVLEAKGDKSAAAIYKVAVSAIRRSELADEYYKIGLFDRAFSGYREALGRFADAYCIQSRLAIQLTKQGRYAEAVQHYRRAYELMPDSFGRVESHCFGCESIFADAGAQTIAEEVFERALAQNRQKAQTHYLLGYLREEQGRYNEALQHYRNAVALDPEYLNAWKHLDSLAARTYIEPTERDISRLRMLELDPQQRHVQVDAERIGDFSGLWRAVERAQLILPQSQAVYRMRASAEKFATAQQALPAELREQMQAYQSIMDDMRTGDRTPGPQAALAKHTVISLVSLMMGAQPSEY